MKIKSVPSKGSFRKDFKENNHLNLNKCEKVLFPFKDKEVLKESLGYPLVRTLGKSGKGSL